MVVFETPSIFIFRLLHPNKVRHVLPLSLLYRHTWQQVLSSSIAACTGFPAASLSTSFGEVSPDVTVSWLSRHVSFAVDRKLRNKN